MIDYLDEIPNYGDLFTLDEFIDSVGFGALIDYDGYGCPAKGEKANLRYCIFPSELEDKLPDDCTHIVWFNR